MFKNPPFPLIGDLWKQHKHNRQCVRDCTALQVLHLKEEFYLNVIYLLRCSCDLLHVGKMVRPVKMSRSVPCPLVWHYLWGIQCCEQGCVMSPSAHLSLSLHPLLSLGNKDGSVFQCWSVVPPWACPKPVPSKMALRCVCVCLSGFTLTHM